MTPAPARPSKPSKQHGLSRPKHLLVIGIGNVWRKDDGVGLAVSRALIQRRLANVEVVESEGGLEMVRLFRNAPSVAVVDAMSSGGRLGTLRRFDAAKRPIPARAFRISTHAVGLPAAIELARALGMLPKRLIVLGIEGKVFGAGEGLSPQVVKAVPKAVAFLATLK